MAFALPSFNAAVASANTSGLPLQRMQAAIDFGDVNQTYATKMLGKQALEEFITEANIAKQALNEYGAIARNNATLDFRREELEARKDEAEQKRKDARRSKLFEMLGGGMNDLFGAGPEPQYEDPKVTITTDQLFRRINDEYLRGEMGGLHPDAALKVGLEQMRGRLPSQRGANNDALQGVFQVQPQAVPKLEPVQATSQADLFKKLLELNPQKKK